VQGDERNTWKHSNPRKDLSCCHNSAKAFFLEKMHKSGHILREGKKSEVVIFRQYEFLKVLPEQTRILKKLHAILVWQVRTVDSGFLFHSDHTGIGSDFQDQNWNQN
jgi:hypothetical protein